MLSFAAPGFLELRGYRAGAAAIASRLAQGAAERHARPCCAIGAQAKAIHRGWEWDCENGALRSQPPTLDSARRQISPVACWLSMLYQLSTLVVKVKTCSVFSVVVLGSATSIPFVLVIHKNGPCATPVQVKRFTSTSK